MKRILDKLKLKSRYNSLSFRISLLIVSTVLLISIFIGIYIYTSIYMIFTDNNIKEITQLLQQININVETQLGMVDITSRMILTNPLIKENLNEYKNNDTYEEFLRKQRIQNQLNYISAYNYPLDIRFLKSIFLFDKNRNYFYIIQKYYSLLESEEKIIDKTLRVYNQTSETVYELKIIPPTFQDKTIYYIRNINDPSSLKLKGKIIMGLNEEKLSDIYKAVSKFKGLTYFLVDSNGTIFSHTDKTLLSKPIDSSFSKFINYTGLMEANINDKIYLGTSRKISSYNLTSIIVLPKNEAFEKLSGSILSYIYIVLIIMLVFTVFSWYFSVRTTKPLKDMMKFIQNIGSDNFRLKMPAYKYLELNGLSNAFNKMTNEIHMLINEVYEKLLLLKESELKSLQAQINPHFIFNVLETVGWEARICKQDSIYETINSLGKLIRAPLSMSKREKITISEELQYIELYLYLQKKRFSDKLKTTINIYDKSVLDCYIPKLCIQPIIENAIVHGLEKKTGIGTLTMEISNENDIILIEVSDDGIGFNTDEVDLEAPRPQTHAKEMHNNIGLYNSNKRIKLMYGEEFGISIYSRINSGTNVFVRIPADKAGD